MREFLGLSTAGLLIAVSMAAVGGPASATPPLQCVETFTQTVDYTVPAGQAAIDTITVDGLPVAGTIVDLNVKVSVSGVASNLLGINFDDPSTSAHYTGLTFKHGGTGDGLTNLTFDDESANGSITAATAPLLANYQPLNTLTVWDGATANRDYRLDISNFSLTTAATWSSWSLILTYTGCDDADGDMVDDKWDNCPEAANADQANHDEDASGDACDDNDDGDTLPDLEDFCDLIPAETTTGCPSQSRTLTLKYRNGAYRGVVSSGDSTCISGATVTVVKVQKGPDRVVGDATTNGAGKYALSAKRGSGTYMATLVLVLVPNSAECAIAKSPKLKL